MIILTIIVLYKSLIHCVQSQILKRQYPKSGGVRSISHFPQRWKYYFLGGNMPLVLPCNSGTTFISLTLPSLEWAKGLVWELEWEYFKWSSLETTLCRCGRFWFSNLFRLISLVLTRPFASYCSTPQAPALQATWFYFFSKQICVEEWVTIHGAFSSINVLI